MTAGGPIVIVGGGVIGVALAYHLADLGHSHVLVLERGLLGEGATAKATGGIRTQFSSRLNVELTHAAVRYYSSFEERVGEPLDFRQHGYLFVLDDETQFEQFRRNAEMQRSVGVRVEVLAPDDIASLMPGIRLDGLLGGTYTPDDGSAAPADVVRAYTIAAQRRGARLLQHANVVGIDRHPVDGHVTAVRTPTDTYPAEVVVIAAGPWSESVGALAGVDIPVEPHSRQAFGIVPVPQLRADMPLTVDMGSGAYLHPGIHGGVIGGNDRETPRTDEAKVDWGLTEQLVAALVHRIPWMADVQIAHGWAGLREMTPDDHGIVGPVPAVPGLWLATGFSGHGFMQAPTIADALAHTLLGRDHPIDLTPLRSTRFTENALIAENALF